MNIIIANTREMNPRIGGVESVSNTLAKGLILYGHNVLFVACIKSRYEVFNESNITQIFLPSFEYLDTENEIFFNKVCIDNKINLIINQAGNIHDFSLLCSRVSHSRKIPLISSIHVNPTYRLSILKDYSLSKLYPVNYLKFIFRYLLRILKKQRIIKKEIKDYRNLLSFSDKVVVLSEGYISDLKIFTKLNKDNIISIPNSINKTKAYHHIREKSILFAGRLEFSEKRPDRVLMIWEKIHLKFPDWKLYIAGDGTMKNDMIIYAKKKKITNIFFLGFVNLEEYYERASILCLTSTYEGFPMVILEAMSHGCVPFSFDSFSSVRDLITDNYDGVIIKSFSLKEYCYKLEQLMNNEEKIRAMSLHSKIKAKNFSEEIVLSKWLELVGKF
jgi:glycosyltransferase involved in cell wall biosynthesis